MPEHQEHQGQEEHQGHQAQNQSRRKVRRTTVRALFLIAGMFAFAFALVPLYNVFCDITGLNGRTSNLSQIAPQVDAIEIDESREVRIQFLATNNKGMPWKFQPNSAEMTIHPGEIHTTTYYAENPTTKYMIAQAIPSVSPGQAATYLRKLECFCFNEQPLAAGASMDMPVRFFVHKALPPEVTTITLSYTMFDITGDSANTPRHNGMGDTGETGGTEDTGGTAKHDMNNM